jgi:hypothetical protein
MKKVITGFLLFFIVFGSCNKAETENSRNNSNQTIITNDTTGNAGVLIVRVFDFSTGNLISNANVFLYVKYEDIARNIYLNTLKTSANGQVNFGYLLTGNYYLRATNGNKADTSIAQVIPSNTVTKNLFLK